jgi:hypothetical protein
LLRALRGHRDPGEECNPITNAPPSRLRWNRQFALMAYAVVLGRSGDHSGAEKAFVQAQEAGEPFVMARHLGARLVAEAALADGWGDPVGWLREAEIYFHSASVPAVAAACRSLLRQAGATVSQRREGHHLVPKALRRLGVTAREYDVLRLLAERMGNKEIGERLYISPRTVEKHVAKLITKTMQADRATLASFAAAVEPP